MTEGLEGTARYTAYVMNGNGANLLRACLERRPAWRLHVRGADPQEAWQLWWGSNGQYCPFKRLVKGEGSFTRVMNRLPNVREIATKGRLAFHISKHMARLNQPPDFIPETHVVSAKLQFGKEKDRLQEASSRNQKEGFGTVWIAKPDNRNRGRDISVHKSMDCALEHINTKGSMGSTWVLQKYIERPLLVSGRKFDIRSFVLVTPNKQAWLHSESYIRTSGVEYTLENLDDRSIHLTNDAIQKNYEHYDSFEDHNKLNLEAFQAILERQGETINVQNDLLPQMKDAAAHVFSATLPSLNSQCLSSCFELFGLDFMVDAQGKVYLIEVNSCPALALQGKVLENLLPRVVEEVVQKAVDPLFPGSAPASRQTLQGFKPLQTQTLRARPLMRVHSTPVAHDSSPSPCRKLVKTNSAPAKPETTSLPQRMHSSVQTIASKG